MKLTHAVLLNVAVVAAGLFVYDRWVAARAEDPVSDAALDRFERQARALAVRKGKQRDPRMKRVAEALANMGLRLNGQQVERVLAALAGGFKERERVVRDPALASWTNKEFAARYLAAVQPTMNQIRLVLPEAEAAEAVIKRFVYDGRALVKPDPSKTPKDTGLNGN